MTPTKDKDFSPFCVTCACPRIVGHTCVCVCDFEVVSAATLPVEKMQRTAEDGYLELGLSWSPVSFSDGFPVCAQRETDSWSARSVSQLNVHIRYPPGAL